ncbi:MAG: ferrochelatase, partial [Planctomycetota bacterium]
MPESVAHHGRPGGLAAWARFAAGALLLAGAVLALMQGYTPPGAMGEVLRNNLRHGIDATPLFYTDLEPCDATAGLESGQDAAVLLIHLGTPKTELEDAARTQASALESKLPEGMRVFAAACHGRPTIAEVLHRVEDLGLEAVVAVSMYPPYSRTTTLPVARELYRQIEHFRYRMDVTMRGVWYDDAGYINAQAHLLHEYAHAHDLTPDNAHLVYAVRSIPASDADGGDPYLDQVHRTAELVSRRLGWPADRTTLAYLDWPGSSGGLRPTMSEALADLSRSGEKIALLCALGFTTDCPQVQAAGVKPFPCPGL